MGFNSAMDVLREDAGSFAARLREVREAAGLTQADLAQRVGMTQGQISKLERGEREESTKTAEIAHECGVNAYWLATGKGPKQAGRVGPFELLMDEIGDTSQQLTLNFLQFQVNTNTTQLGPEKTARYLKWIDEIIADMAKKKRGDPS